MQTIQRLLQIAVATGLTAYLVGSIGPEALAQTLVSARAAPLAAAAVMTTTGFVLNGLSLWLLFFLAAERPPPARLYWRAFFTTCYYALFLPGRAGDFTIALLLRDVVPPAHSLVYVTLDKLITLLVMVLVGGGAVTLLLDPRVGVALITGGLLAFVAALWLATRRGLLAILLRYRRLRRPLARLVRVIKLIPHPESRRLLLGNLAVTLVRLLIVGWSLMFLLAAFGGKVGYPVAVGSVAAVQLLSLVPISVQGIGVLETAYIHLLDSAGVAAATVLAASLAGRILTVILVYGLHVAANLWPPHAFSLPKRP
ncbi:lysylphosphatidylglycerol synthase transmembrane domain-containing protein [Inmirania thermothiophila]|uniref:Uncharacterized membrane protein YbhN (UPF0104 family) n=1 Tax=Inmirania thermothiophila TaxID=1750597 RepID=A0A3N1XST1_9GAMM|nr:lysylphosphatidylglycerol synthase transmembrane domain-containing protein [Inmirania thermothiophila]ROR29706.1 uncharacterized membrane protein YbhN (UPF0104 family) [Inmirania thermothiophila]